MQRSTPSGGQLDADAQGLQDVGGAATAGGGAVAVLGDAHTGAGGDESSGGGNVESVGAVAAGAHRVDQRAFDAHLEGELAHDGGHAGDLLGGLALEPQGGEERSQLAGSGLSLHDLAHHCRRFVHGQGAAGNEQVYCFTNVHGLLLR